MKESILQKLELYSKRSTVLRKLTTEEIKFLNTLFNDSLSIDESVGRLLHNVSTHPLCEYCGKPVKIAVNNYSAFAYQHTCGDKECIYKYRRDYLSFKNDAVRNNAIMKFKEKYKVDNPSQVPHIQKKINDTWKSHSEERTKEITDKRCKTSELLYNDKYYAARQGAKGAKEKWENISDYERQLIYEKHKNSFRNTYGVDWYSKLPNHRNYISNLMKQEDINAIRIPKYIKSFLEKHNITPASEIHTMSELMLDPNVKAYRYNVMKKNNTFNSSKREDKIYSLLIEYFPDVIRQYTSVLYPFNCDFYIPSLDLYIEYNGSQFHLDHPFNENDENDIQILNNLKEKSNEKHKISNKSNQYDHMIFVWSISDVLKRNIAKENNLNYVEFWDLDGTDVKLWLEKFKK